MSKPDLTDSERLAAATAEIERLYPVYQAAVKAVKQADEGDIFDAIETVSQAVRTAREVARAA